MFDTGAAIHVCPIWFCDDYRVLEPHYDSSLKEHHDMKYKSTVSGPYACNSLQTNDQRSTYNVVASDVIEPIISYTVLRPNGVKVDLSRLEHATLPNGAKIPH